MKYLSLDTSKLAKFIQENELKEIKPLVKMASQELNQGTGVGNQFREWMDLPDNYDQDEFNHVKKAAKEIQNKSKVLIVIGIGGSYLGAKMAIDFLHSKFFNSLPDEKRKVPQVIFAGNSLSANYIHDLIDLIGDRDFSVNVISKSGTTTEPAIAFRIFRDLLVKKYGKNEAKNRIYVTTDKKSGTLRKEAEANNLESFTIPNGVGGRFSVLSSVGLLPIAVSGVNIDQLMQGAFDAKKHYAEPDLFKNEAYQYAAYRNILYRKGYTTEILANYEPNMLYLAEWWKQLMGESEGKDQKGIYPSSANFSTDLHSLGQYIQEGRRNLIETVIAVDHPKHNVDIPKEDTDLDGLKYLEGRSMDYVNQTATTGVSIAHTTGNVPNLTIHIKNQSPYTLGYLIYFFEVSVAISGYLNGINPFNQPGVEEYKKNMFALLGKPGYEKLGQKLKNNLKK